MRGIATQKIDQNMKKKKKNHNQVTVVGKSQATCHPAMGLRIVPVENKTEPLELLV